jgi:hypothetical protein
MHQRGIDAVHPDDHRLRETFSTTASAEKFSRLEVPENCSK